MRRMLVHFRRLLQALADPADQPLAAIKLADDAERAQVLADLNQTDRTYPTNACLHHLFEAQVERQPDALAVAFGGDQLTYRQLDERANQLAHHLQALGVGPDMPVALCLQRSLDLVVAVLGVLKAGGAYLPLDPRYPAARLRYMLDNGATPVIITHRASVAALPPTETLATKPVVVCLDQDAQAIATRPLSRPSSPTKPHHLLYVLYTSGSTGQPKGVAMPHAPLVNLIQWQLEESKIGLGQRTLQFAPLGFDVACQEIFATLAAGGTLCLIDEEQRRDPAALLQMLDEQSVARVFLPFVALQQLAEVAVGTARFPSSLREVITAGEQLQVTPALVEFFQRLGHQCRLVNQYGPTECHVVSSYTLSGPPAAWPRLPPIGGGGGPFGTGTVANTRLYVLDSARQPVPVGLPGELYIGGVAVARGYLNDAPRTAERFMHDPFSTVPGARMYRTGDLGRYGDDGTLEFLGRVDDQVKVRGFRVEPGEIEATLLDHPAVGQAAVVVREDRAPGRASERGDKRLVAYIVVRKDTPSPQELQAFVAARLPAYMVPSAFVQLPDLPLTPSGKVDRRALCSAAYAPPEPRVVYVGARSEVEELLTTLWAEVLGVTSPGVHEDFFDLGGHSLLAIQLVARIRASFEIDVPLRILFEHPVLGDQAAWLTQQQRGDRFAPIEVQPEDAPLVMSYEQQAFWLRSQLDQQAAVHNMHRAVWLRGPLNRPALHQAMRQLLERQAGLRLFFPQVGQESEVACHLVYDPLQFLDFSDLPEAEQTIRLQQTAHRQATTPFDLAHERLLRLHLIRLSNESHVLLLTLHHILGDAWSLAIWEREWRALYVAACQQTSASAALPPLPIQYTDYAAWQRYYLSGERFSQQQDYWLNQLRDAPQLLQLPTDYPRPAQQQGQGDLCTFTLSPELHHALQQVARQHNCTLFMVLFSAFNLLLYRFSGQTDLCIGVPVANRRHPETQNLIGIFLNILAMRTRIDGQASFAHLLQQVRRQTLAAHTHADFPFAHLLPGLKPTPQQAYNPYFQVMFNWVTIPRAEAPAADTALGSGSELRIEPFPDIVRDRERAISNLDLVVTLAPAADGGIRTQWHYDTALFKAATVDLLAESYQRILAQVVAHAQTALKDFALADVQTPLYPLTLAQRDIWVDQMLCDETPLYNIGGHVHLSGPLDVERFRQAVGLLIQKHDNLRLQLTKSRDENGVPQQTVVPPFRVQIPLHDLRGEAAPQGVRATALQWMQQRFVQSFTLEGEPLFRYDLIRVADEEYYWLMQYHHLIVDGWGIALLNRSLAELYSALSQGQTPDLQSHSYLDYVADDQSYLQSAHYDTQRAYWLKQYPSVPEPLLRPRASDNGPVASDCSAIHLPRALYQQLELLAKQYQASTFHVLIGAVALYFARTQGRDEFVIGLPILNRPSAAFKATAGLFTGVSPTRLQIDMDASFGDLLRNISQTLRANYRHQRFPVGEINRVVKPATHHRQLYDIGLSYENHDYEAHFDSLASHTELLLHGWEQTPLMLYLRDFYAGADVKWDFVANRAYFTAQEIAKLQQHLVQLLNTVLMQAEIAIGQLSLVTDTEHQQLLVEWNQMDANYPSDKTIHQLFHEQVTRTPEAVALIDGKHQLTYREVEEKANRLAHYLIKLGVAPNEPIGIYLDRSSDAVITILAILKTGAAYVPLDLNSPPARLRTIVKEAGIKLLLIDADPFPNPDGERVELLTIVSLFDNAANCPITPPDISVTPKGVAYVMYTSGSTGAPKGVVVPHRAVVRLVEDPDFLTIGEQDVFLLLSPLSFDASTFELWGSLVHGAKLIVLPERLPSLNTIASTIQQHRVSVLWLTAALFHLLADEYPQILAQVRCLLAGGDVLDPTRVRAVVAKMAPGTTFVNGYGPTENTTFSCCYSITDLSQIGVTIPIGRPIRGSTAYILDSCQQPAPIGVAGELYVGGVGLALGYLNRPDLTAERFIPHPFSNAPAGIHEERLYRTGDLARYRKDGVIEFLGRVDRQVKIRGFRVELGEIEAVLRKHPAVRDGAVDVLDDEMLGKRIIAWWIGKGETETDSAALRNFLRESLPDYMLPAAFVRMDTFPLNPNGKVDLCQLPAPDPDLHPAPPQSPQTLLERQLLAIWQQVLGTKNLGIDDDFFDVGGHSLLAIRLLARVSEATGQELPVASLFYGPSIRQQAALVEQKGWSTPWKSLVQVQGGSTRPPLFLYRLARQQPFDLGNLPVTWGAINRYTALTRLAWMVGHTRLIVLKRSLPTTWTNCCSSCLKVRICWAACVLVRMWPMKWPANCMPEICQCLRCLYLTPLNRGTVRRGALRNGHQPIT